MNTISLPEVSVLEKSSRQWIRKAELFISNNLDALRITDLRVTFRTENALYSTPNLGFIRVYNLSEEKVRFLTKNPDEFTTVWLQAGYEHSYGNIFKGEVKQFRMGKESNVDSYLDIYAADGDLIYNFTIVNQTLNGGSNAMQRMQVVLDAAKTDTDAHTKKVLGDYGGILPGPKVMFGMARSYLNELANSANAMWSIQDGKIVLVPLDGVVPGTAVQLNSHTGMIGQPEATDNGIEVTCLLNPLIHVGSMVQINNADINKTQVTASGKMGFPNPKSLENIYFARTTDDGFYKVFVVECEGDTRGNNWYSHITCLDAPGGNVKAYG